MATRKTAETESRADKTEAATEQMDAAAVEQEDAPATEAEQKDAPAVEPESASETAKADEQDAINARVLSKFRDKVSGSYLEPGICLHMSRKRFDEINSVAPLLEEI